MSDPVSVRVEPISRGAGYVPELASLPRETLDALGVLIVVLADNELLQGLRVATWATGRPAFKSAVACATAAQAKLGHSQALYALLDELPPVRIGLGRHTDRVGKHYALSCFDQPFDSWGQVAATLAIVEPALNLVLHALSNSAFAALARRAQQILGEERATSVLAEDLARELVARDERHATLQCQVDALLAEVLCWFGPPGEASFRALVEQGLIKGDATAYRRTFIGQLAPQITNESLRQIYIDQVAPLLSELNIQTSLQREEETGLWSYAPLPWGRWNSRRRRLSSAIRLARSIEME